MSALDFIKRHTGALHILVLATLVPALYAGTLGYPWEFDDGKHILMNPAVREARAIFDQDYARSLGVEPLMARVHQGRPLGFLSFNLSYRLSGYGPEAWRAVNIALHVGCTLVLYAFLRLLFGVLAPEWGGLAALWGAALFAAHPLATESVIYVAQRTNLMASFFYLCALASYLKWRLRGGRAFYALALMSVLASMLSKETGFTAPLAIMLLELALTRSGAAPRAERRQALLALAPFALALFVVPMRLVMYALSRGGSAGLMEAVASSSTLMPEATRSQYMATQSIVVFKYLWLLLWPSGMNVDYYFLPVAGFAQAQVLVSCLGHLGVLGAVAYTLLRSAEGGRGSGGLARALALLVLLYYLALSVESSVLPLKEMMVEYRTYLPGAFLLAALAAAVASGLKYLWGRLDMRALALAALVVAMAWPVGLAGATYIRALAWKSEAALWVASLEENPDNPRALNNLAVQYMNQGKDEGAIGLLERSIIIKPDYAQTHRNLYLLYTRTGRYEAAERGYRELLAHPVTDPDIYAGYGLLALKTGRAALAVQMYTKYLSLRPGIAMVHRDRALAYRMLGNIPAAEADEARAR